MSHRADRNRVRMNEGIRGGTQSTAAVDADVYFLKARIAEDIDAPRGDVRDLGRNKRSVLRHNHRTRYRIGPGRFQTTGVADDVAVRPGQGGRDHKACRLDHGIFGVRHRLLHFHRPVKDGTTGVVRKGVGKHRIRRHVERAAVRERGIHRIDRRHRERALVVKGRGRIVRELCDRERRPDIGRPRTLRQREIRDGVLTHRDVHRTGFRNVQSAQRPFGSGDALRAHHELRVSTGHGERARCRIQEIRSGRTADQCQGLTAVHRHVVRAFHAGKADGIS